MTDLLIVVSTPDAGPLLPPLAAALARAGANWSCFFTGEGVRALATPAVAAAVQGAARAVACEHSWHHWHGGESRCPVALGSQIDHSEMLGGARRALGL